MAAGLWQQHQLSDGTYTFEDLVDVHELLDVRAENERRVRAASEEENSNGH